MSIAIYSVSDAAIAAQAAISAQAVSPSPGKKPPPKRTIVAVGDTTQSPEPR